MDLGISSLGYVIDLALNEEKNHPRLIDLLMDATEQSFLYAERNDINVLEVLIEPPDIFGDENRQLFINLCKEFPKIKKQVHAPFIDMCMCSHNKYVSEAALDVYFESAKISEEINASTMTIHPGVSNYLMQKIQRFNKQILTDAVLKLLDVTKNFNVKLCMENMPKGVNMLQSLDDLSSFFEDIDRQELYFTWDTSHSWTNDLAAADVWQNMGPITKNIHLVDNQDKETDKHPTLGTGKVDFEDIIELLKQNSYQNALIIELSSAEGLDQSIEYVKKIL